MNTARLAWLLFRRDWRSGEIRVMLFAIIIAVTCLSSIGLFTDRISRALQNETATLFGGDLVVTSDRPIKKEWREYAAKEQLRDSLSLSFLSMVEVNGEFRLAAIKAVDERYPLLGELKVSPEWLGKGKALKEGPPAGTIWLVPRLAASLSAKAGDTIKVGVASFTQGPFLQKEPDNTVEWSIFAPRLMMRLEDVDKTHVIQPGSRLSYRWSLIGPADAIARTKNWIQTQAPETKILSANENQPTLGNILNRAKEYFHLAALVSMALTSIACAMTIKRYTERHYRYVALLRTFGMQQRQIVQVYLANVLGLGLIAALLGGILGIIGQWFLDTIFTQLLSITLPSLSLLPIFFAMVLVLMTLVGVGLPHLLQLKNIPTILVFRKTTLLSASSSWYWYAGTFGLVLLLSYFTVQSLTVLGYFMASLVGMSVLLLSAGWLLLATLQGLRTQFGSAWRFGIANVSRYRTNSLVLLVGFGLSIMVLLLMLDLQSGLLEDWRGSLPPSTPNYFVVNIPSQEVKKLNTFFDKHGITSSGLYPLIRGRLTTLNNKPFAEAIPESARSDEALQRSLNLTWQTNLPEKNHLLEGTWWSPSQMDQRLVSVERGFAERLHLKINDNIGVTINEQVIQAKIVNIREVNWGSFRPTFYMIYPPNLLDQFPSTFMTSFYLPKDKNKLLVELMQSFRSASVIDVADITERLQSLISNVVAAILFILGFIFIASLSVLMAGVQANITDRTQAAMVLKALGTRQRDLTIMMLNEFLVIGAIAGLIAGMGANVTSILLSKMLFQLVNYSVWHLIVLGPVFGIILVTSLGYIASRSVLKQPATTLLRLFET